MFTVGRIFDDYFEIYKRDQSKASKRRYGLIRIVGFTYESADAIISDIDIEVCRSGELPRLIDSAKVTKFQGNKEK